MRPLTVPWGSLKVRRYLGVGQLPVEGERDHLLLHVRQPTQQPVEFGCLLAVDHVVGQRAGDGVQRDRLLAGSASLVPAVFARYVDRTVTHQGEQPSAQRSARGLIGGAAAPY